MFKLKIVKGQGKGKSWGSLTISDFADRKFLTGVGKIFVDSIVREAKKQAGFERAGIGNPEGIPKDPAFFMSFKSRITDRGQVEVYSTWPTIQQVVEGRDPYKQAGVNKVPFTDPLGKVIIRSTPQTEKSAWLHPGFAKHTFIQQGYDKALPEVQQLFSERIIQVLKKNSPI